ncbi:MAG TPA: isopentenyl-diphosphate Delta-isomerase [Blastocatellia bacterium]|nr:isopentenyl-diphosphate Delta-isomerase [Blastocatellia bacterium]
MEELILVNENDEQVGTGEKLQVHREGRLHRAFSIFVFDSLGRLLLQKRAESKYHSGGLWSNTCCGHPRPGEATEAAARRRLREEMNFDCELRPHSSFIYRAELDNELIEWEFDHILVGAYDENPAPNDLEADDWQWIGIDELKAEVKERPARFTYWLKAALGKLDLANLSNTLPQSK